MNGGKGEEMISGICDPLSTHRQLTGWANQEGALWDFGAEFLILPGRLQKVDELEDLLLCFVTPRYVLEHDLLCCLVDGAQLSTNSITTYTTFNSCRLSCP